MAHSNVVPTSTTVTVQPTMDLQTIDKFTSTCASQQSTPTTSETQPNGLSALRNSFRKYNVSPAVMDVLMASWRGGTQKQYKTYINKWLEFCSKRNINHSVPEIGDAVEFLMTLKEQGLSYSTINTARSALSSVLTIKDCEKFGSHPLVMRFMKGIFELNKPQPRYTYIWDVSKVLDYLKTLDPLDKLSLKELTHKTVMLLLLVTGQRGQFLYLLTLAGIQITPCVAYLTLEDHTKTSRPNKTTKPVEITEFIPDKRLCPLATLKSYVKETEKLRDRESKLFLSFIKPYKGVSRDTISRWTKQVLHESGIDTKLFSSHSTRAATASKAKQKDVPLDIILSTIGWDSAQTFQKFYQKPLLEPRGSKLANAVLS